MPYVHPAADVVEVRARYASHHVDVEGDLPTVEYVSPHYSMYTAGDGFVEIEAKPEMNAMVYSLARQALVEAQATLPFREAEKRRATARLARELLPRVERAFERHLDRHFRCR